MANAAGKSYVAEFNSDLFAPNLAQRMEAIKRGAEADQFWHNFSAAVEETALEKAIRQLSCFSGVTALLSGYYIVGRLLFA